MVDVGGDDGGVDAQLAAAQQLAGRQLRQQRGLSSSSTSGPARSTSLLSVVGYGTG
jgi:hypothetical protein